MRRLLPSSQYKGKNQDAAPACPPPHATTTSCATASPVSSPPVSLCSPFLLQELRALCSETGVAVPVGSGPLHAADVVAALRGRMRTLLFKSYVPCELLRRFVLDVCSSPSSVGFADVTCFFRTEVPSSSWLRLSLSFDASVCNPHHNRSEVCAIFSDLSSVVAESCSMVIACSASHPSNLVQVTSRGVSALSPHVWSQLSFCGQTVVSESSIIPGGPFSPWSGTVEDVVFFLVLDLDASQDALRDALSRVLSNQNVFKSYDKSVSCSERGAAYSLRDSSAVLTLTEAAASSHVSNSERAKEQQTKTPETVGTRTTGAQSDGDGLCRRAAKLTLLSEDEHQQLVERENLRLSNMGNTGFKGVRMKSNGRFTVTYKKDIIGNDFECVYAAARCYRDAVENQASSSTALTSDTPSEQVDQVENEKLSELQEMSRGTKRTFTSPFHAIFYARVWEQKANIMKSINAECVLLEDEKATTGKDFDLFLRVLQKYNIEHGPGKTGIRGVTLMGNYYRASMHSLDFAWFPNSVLRSGMLRKALEQISATLIAERLQNSSPSPKRIKK